MKKYGFTLAEVLITLGLIGVVAALTMPGLTANAQKAQVGPALAKVVSVLENANRLILADNAAGSLDEACGQIYVNCIRNYVPGSIMDSSDYPNSLNNYDYYATDDGMVLYVERAFLNDFYGGANIPDRYNGSGYWLYVDINGTKNPNAGGRDRFHFFVDGYGRVIPHGGRAMNDLLGVPDSTPAWDGDSDAAYLSGLDKCKRGEDIGNGINCAGSVADNGWKVVY